MKDVFQAVTVDALPCLNMPAFLFVSDTYGLLHGEVSYSIWCTWCGFSVAIKPGYFVLAAEVIRPLTASLHHSAHILQSGQL
jgi:hypothetical protein